ncbi:formate dehydrogenase accessory sulfurtransferase FdhD [Halodesulfovibrio sp.]|jgi:FdhD protein|uniref:formate dehydrogenase accessory sulfurtransferase FdhD n=1 Tax=Halodesulfovibrio sp. TaxID=1912772 RepID=UPI0025FBC2B1|nr:formate dehydrogenase accessory sulfurtransferase FdhD [Halodesulfovibrio sp.]MCT4626216.1 formate dehydrogenase accessory sulfurtransferase FdhD [Halodesulfovibrio sp.]
MPKNESCSNCEPKPITVTQYKDGQWAVHPDIVSIEIPVTFHFNGTSHTLWAWPEYLEDLVAGHALLDLGGGSAKTTVEKIGEYEYNVTLCDAIENELDPGKLHGAEMLGAMAKFIDEEGQWHGTGCFHRAGAYDAKTHTMLHRTEDIGRHNCIDRLAGWASRTETPLSGLVLMVSARVTASLCAKAIRAGYKFIISRSAVTSASIAMAQEHDITLIGFARDQEKRFTVFHDLQTPRVLT